MLRRQVIGTIWHERSRVYREKKLPECGATGHGSWVMGHVIGKRKRDKMGGGADWHTRLERITRVICPVSFNGVHRFTEILVYGCSVVCVANWPENSQK